MKKRLKRISLILAVSLILTSIPGSVFAEPLSDVQEDTDATVMATEENEEAETGGTESVEEETQGNLNEEEPQAEPDQKKEENSEKKDPEDNKESGKKSDNDSEGDNKTVSQSDNSTNNEETTENGPEEQKDSVSGDDLNGTVSDNEAEETVSDNTVSENEVSENSISENEVSENSVSVDDIIDGSDIGEGGNIDISMDFDEATIEEVSESSEAKLASFSSGEATLNSEGLLTDSYFGSLDYVDDGIYEPKANQLCWAYTAATMAEINMNKKGLRNRSDAHIDPFQIAQATYNKQRYDNCGETWNKTSDSSSPELITTSKTRVARDYTSFVSNNRLIDVTNMNQLSTAKGNLLYATFNLERWGSPSVVHANSSGEGDDYTENIINYEGDTGHLSAQLENAVWVPSTDLDSIKAMIMEYGSVGIQMSLTISNNSSIKTGSDDGRKTNRYSYIPSYSGYKADHTVALVAWDDNIDKTEFKQWKINSVPYHVTRNGAFLAKSSYQNNTNEEYFWISYDDGAFKKGSKGYRYAIAYDFVKNNNNDYTYGYDGTNYFNYYYTKKVYGIFKSGHSEHTSSGKVEMLKSIGVGVQDAGRYKLTIYTGYDPSGKSQYLNRFEVETMDFELSYPGYHTIELDEPILFFKNDVISVCLEKSDATNFNVLVDGVYEKNSSKSKAAHVSYNGMAQRNESGVYFNAYTHNSRETAESFFATASNSATVVSGNWVPYPEITGNYWGLSPRMRLYTSEISMPKNLDQTMLDIKLKKYIWTHTGKAITPLPEVLVDFTRTEGGEPVDRGGRSYKHGLVMYNKISDGKTEVESHYNYIGVNNTNEGLAAVIVRGKGDVFSGEISIPFKITKEQLNIEKCKILGLEPQDFQELEGRTLNKVYGDIKDNMIVKYYLSETKHYITLTQGVDYAIGSIEGDNKAGKKLTVMVTGMGSFKNTVKPKFKLRKAKDKKPISDATVSVNLMLTVDGKERHWEEGTLPEIPYTGSKIKPEIEGIYDVATGKKLEPGIDYNAKIKYKNNKKAGMASIIIKAQKGGMYSGKITRYFLITPMHVTTDAKVKFKSSYRYTGKPVKPYPTVTLYGKKLKKSDLYVEYKNNTGSSTGSSSAQGIVFGKGRYDGYIGYGNFYIKAGTTTTTSSSSSKT